MVSGSAAVTAEYWIMAVQSVFSKMSRDANGAVVECRQTYRQTLHINCC